MQPEELRAELIESRRALLAAMESNPNERASLWTTLGCLVFWALVRFDSEATERFRAMQPIAEVKPLTNAEYEPRGWTPLLDAVGMTITQLDQDWKAEKPDRCIVVIVTDGHENASTEYTKAKVKRLIEARQASNLWSFIYLGANVDAFAEAGALGIATANTAGWTGTSAGVGTTYSTVSKSVGTMRATGQTVAHNLGVANLGEDPDATPAPTVQGQQTQAWTPPTAKAATPKTAPSVWAPPT